MREVSVARLCNLLFAVLSSCALSGALANAQPGPYIYTTLTIDNPVPGAFLTRAVGLNDHGSITGTFLTPTDEAPILHGFLLSGGSFSGFEYCDICLTDALAINNQDQIVGRSTGPGGVVSFLFSGGQFSDITLPDGSSPPVAGINNVGQMVGQTVDSGKPVGFLFDGSNVSLIDVPGSLSTNASGINDAGQVVGSYSSCPFPGCNPIFIRSHGYVLTDGVFSTLNCPFSRDAHAAGISASGAIILNCGFDQFGFSDGGFVLDEGGFAAIQLPGSGVNQLAAINGQGEILGVYEIGGESRHFLARPAAVVNDLVNLESVETSYDPTPVPGGPAGTFTIQASFTNTSATPIDTPQFVVTKAERQGHPRDSAVLLLNADLPPGFVGSRLTADAGSDGILSPSESLTATFVVGLDKRGTFIFLVDLLGLSAP